MYTKLFHEKRTVASYQLWPVADPMPSCLPLGTPLEFGSLVDYSQHLSNTSRTRTSFGRTNLREHSNCPWTDMLAVLPSWLQGSVETLTIQVQQAPGKFPDKLSNLFQFISWQFLSLKSEGSRASSSEFIWNIFLPSGQIRYASAGKESMARKKKQD